MRTFLLLFLLSLVACSSPYPNQQLVGKVLPKVSGTTLDKKAVELPSEFKSPATLLLLGYKQNSQFDIDRWLIGIDAKDIQIPVYEIPAIQSKIAGLFSASIDEGMRAGIPKELWQSVITVYADGDRLQSFTGNQNPNNARVLLVNSEGKVLYFYDRGFAVAPLNQLVDLIEDQTTMSR